MPWPTVDLDSVAEILGGATPRRHNAAYWDGDIPWVTPSDLPGHKEGFSGAVDTTSSTITDAGLASCSASLLPPGTVLFSSRASIGKIGIASVPLTTNQGFANLIPSPALNSRYLAWCLHFHADRIALLAGSTTFKEVAKAALKRYRIPLPPLSDQRRIVEFLDQANRLRRLRIEAETKAIRILPTIFIKMFGDPALNPKGWRTAPLGHALADTQYGISKRSTTDETTIPILRMNNISPTGDLLLHDLKFVDISPTETQKYLLHTGDLLFNRTNSIDHVGKTALWTVPDVAAVPASYLIRIRTDRKHLLPHYLWALMNTAHMKALLRSRARRAVGMANVNATELQEMRVMLPPLRLQSRFADLAGALRQDRRRRQRYTLLTDGLLLTLMRDAFVDPPRLPTTYRTANHAQ